MVRKLHLRQTQLDALENHRQLVKVYEQRVMSRQKVSKWWTNFHPIEFPHEAIIINLKLKHKLIVSQAFLVSPYWPKHVSSA